MQFAMYFGFESPICFMVGGGEISANAQISKRVFGPQLRTFFTIPLLIMLDADSNALASLNPSHSVRQLCVLS